MENQINMGDQNTQQIGQNPVNQPVQIPEKPKINYWMTPTIILFVLFVVGAGFYFFYAKKDIMPTSSQNLPRSQPTSVPSIINLPTNVEHFIDDQKLISFDYPKGATSVKSVSPSPIGGVGFQAYFREWLTDPNSWSIMVVGVPIVDNVEKTKQDIFDTSDLKESKITNYTEIMETSVGGEKAMSYKTESKLPSDTELTKISSMLTETIHGNMLYSIGIGISDKTNQESVREAMEAYNLIRNSFKFLR